MWSAFDEAFEGRRVALKTVLASRSSSEALARLFVEEARISGAVRHPNLLEMLDAGEHDGVPYLAMEWVEGVTVRRLAEHRIPLPVVLRICMEACDGLHAAHEARTDEGAPLHVVHRDVSPQNLLVSRSGRVKVIDFGIAKAEGRITEDTTEGILRGKVRYMAPEQALGLEVDRRVDVWAVGVTLLELATGRVPYPGTHDIAALVKLVSCEPELPRPGELPDDVRAVVARALRKNPDERFRTARDMGTALEEVLERLGEKNTRRDLAFLVRDRLGSGSQRPVADPPKRPSERSTAQLTVPTQLLPISPNPGKDAVTAKVPPAVLDALIAEELREKPTRSERPGTERESTAGLSVSTATAVVVSSTDEVAVCSGPSLEVEPYSDASGPVPRPGRRKSGFVLASVLMGAALLVAVLGRRGAIDARLFGGKGASAVSVSAPPVEVDAPVEAVSIAPFHAVAPSESAAPKVGASASAKVAPPPVPGADKPTPRATPKPTPRSSKNGAPILR